MSPEILIIQDPEFDDVPINPALLRIYKANVARLNGIIGARKEMHDAVLAFIKENARNMIDEKERKQVLGELYSVITEGFRRAFNRNK